jgi:hypothetical protein
MAAGPHKPNGSDSLLKMADLRAIYTKTEVVCMGISRDLGTLLAAEQMYHVMSVVVFTAFITVNMGATERLDPFMTHQMYGVTGCHIVLLYALLHYAEGLARQVPICMNGQFAELRLI